MLPKPLLWSLRVLAVSSFVGVIAWQVVRRQKEANPPPESNQPPEPTHVLGSKSGAVMMSARPLGEKSPSAFWSSSKAFQPEDGLVSLPEEKDEPKPRDHTFFSSSKSGGLVVVGTRMIAPDSFEEDRRSSQGWWEKLSADLGLGGADRPVGRPLRAEWKINATKSAPVVLPREVDIPGAQGKPKEPTFIPGTKSSIMSVPRPLTEAERKAFLEEMGVDLDLGPPPGVSPITGTKSGPLLREEDLRKKKLTPPDRKPTPAPGGIIDSTGKSAGLILPQEIKPSPNAPAQKP